jgi:hypothetical protein
MTEATVIDHSRWEQFFNQLSKDHEGDLIRLELLDQTYGDQVAGEDIPFTVASYDPRNDAVVITAGRTDEGEPALRHIINHPSEIDLAIPEPTEPVLRVVAPTNTTLTYFYPKPSLPPSG